MHLAKNPDDFQRAIDQQIPFYRTACGDIVSLQQISIDMNRVDCPICYGMIQRHLATQEQERESLDDDEGAESVMGTTLDLDLSDFDEGDFDLDSSSGEDDEEGDDGEPEDPSAAMLMMVNAAVAPLLEGVVLEEGWERWLAPLDERLEDEEGRDLRQHLTEAEVELLSGLTSMASMLGLDTAIGAVISILHRHAVLAARVSEEI